MRSLITFISLLILGACDSGQNKNNDTVKANDTAATDYGLDTSIDTDTGTDSGSDTGEDPITIPTEIVLDQYSMLLPGTTATDSVEAMVYNADRMRIPNAVVNWTSNNESVVTVENGVLTAAGEMGLAMVRAEIDGIESDPLTILVADPVDGAIIVSDDQIRGISVIDPNAEVDVGWQYSFTLTDEAAPAPGTILLANGDSNISGRVVSTESLQDGVRVTMEAVTIDALFEELSFEQEYDLSELPYEIPDELDEYYTVVTDEDGWMELVPINPELPPPPDVQRGVLESLDCENEGAGPSVSYGGLDYKVRNGLFLNLDVDGSKVKVLRVLGSIDSEVSVRLSVDGSFSGSYKCKGSLIKVPIPAGPAGPLFGPQVELGGGFEVGGSVDMPEWYVEPYARPSLSVNMGMTCDPDCLWSQNITPGLETGIDYEIPSIESYIASTLEGNAKAFGYTDVSLAVRFFSFTLAELTFFETEGGLKAEAFFQAREGQANAVEKASEVTLKTYIEGGLPSNHVSKIEKIFGSTGTPLRFNLENTLARTPTGSVNEIDPSITAQTGMPITLSAELQNVNFLGSYNVAMVRFFLYDPAQDIGLRLTEVASVNASLGQTLFEAEWTPTQDQLRLRNEGMPWIHVFFEPVINPLLNHHFEVGENAKIVIPSATIIDGTTESLSGGTHNFHSLYIINGGKLNIEGDVHLNLTGTLRVDSNSTIDGNGGGHQPNQNAGMGNGPCAGGWTPPLLEEDDYIMGASSGGGYGGLGGNGGSDDPLNIAVGGCVTGTPSGSDIEMGSSAGSADYGVGGAGGASLRVTAEAIDIAGEITMNGEDGTTYTGRNGGGGAGGGILLDAETVTVSGLLSADGGHGGTGDSLEGDGGGGGGGGRIKVFSNQGTFFTGAASVIGGQGNPYGWYVYGTNGEDGTTHGI